MVQTAESANLSNRVARAWTALLVLPVAGLALLLLRPELDVQWEHHPSHFWLVLVTAAVNVALAYLTNVAAGRYRDARLVLVSLAFLSSAGFLGLHALATPGVLLPHPNTGFVVATPVGLVIASVFAPLGQPAGRARAARRAPSPAGAPVGPSWRSWPTGASSRSPAAAARWAAAGPGGRRHPERPGDVGGRGLRLRRVALRRCSTAIAAGSCRSPWPSRSSSSPRRWSRSP